MSFSTFQVAKILGVRRERFRGWLFDGLVKPSIVAEGMGTRAKFTTHDVYRAAIFCALVDAGVNRKKASNYVYSSLVALDDKLNQTTIIALVLDPKYNVSLDISESCFFTTFDGEGPWELNEKNMGGEFWHIGHLINVKAIRNNIDEKINEL